MSCVIARNCWCFCAGRLVVRPRQYGGRVKSKFPELAWSKTRHELLQACPRAFVTRYLDAWGGHEPDAPAWKRELHTLKQLTTRYMWAGRVVHSAVSGVLLSLRHGLKVDEARVIGRMHQVMREDFASSRARDYRHRLLREDFAGLIEHEHGDAVPSADWQALWLSTKRAVEWFLQSKWVVAARALQPGDWLEVDTRDLKAMKFPLDGTPTYAVADFAFRSRSTGLVELVEWKSGPLRPSDALQVAVQALGLHVRYGVPVEQLRGTLVSLRDGREVPVSLSAADLAQARTVIRRSVASMRPLWKPRVVAPQTSDLSVCRQCAFRRPCGREFEVLKQPVSAVAGPLECVHSVPVTP